MKHIPDFLRTPNTGDERTLFHPILMRLPPKKMGKTYEDFLTDYRVLVASNLYCMEKFDFDAVMTISDPCREPSGFGAKIIFDGDSPPRAEVIVHSAGDIARLRNPNPYDNFRMLDRIKGVELFRQKLGIVFPVIGWIDGPLAVASMLGGVSDTLLNLALKPAMIQELMNKCLITCKDFAKAQIDAGANIMGVGDAICSQVSPEMYREYVYPLHKELFEYIHSLGVKIKLHICGNITHLLTHITTVGVDIVDIDWMVSMTEARKTLGTEVWLCGNSDPVRIIQDGTEEEITENYNKIKRVMGAGKFIYSAGCEITPDTSDKNLLLMRRLTLK